MDKIIGRSIKVDDDILNLVEIDYNMIFNNYMVINQYEDIEDLLVGFFVNELDMNYYKGKLLRHGFDPMNDMNVYNFKTFFVPTHKCNYKQITRLAKIKQLLDDTK